MFIETYRAEQATSQFATQFVRQAVEALRASQDHALAQYRKRRHAHGYHQQRLAEAFDTARLVADPRGQRSVVDVQVDGDAAVIDGAFIGVLNPQFDRHAQFHVLAGQRFEAGH
ncbi:hypothetical protein D3C81_1466960 [compost metagenome]